MLEYVCQVYAYLESDDFACQSCSLLSTVSISQSTMYN